MNPTGNNDVGVSENGLHTPGREGVGGNNIENQLNLSGTFILINDIQYTILFWSVQQT